MESFNLNIIPGKTRPVCHASQFDTGRVIRVNLFEDANIYTLSGSEEVSLSVRKPDGNVVTASIENTGDSFVEIVTTEQMTACAGSNLCELKIEDDGKVIGTMNFILETEQDPLEGGIESQSEIDNLETQVNNMVVEAVADQYDSNAVIFDQEPTAGHGNGYAVTSAGIKAAIDNAVGSLSTEIEGLSTNVDSLTSEVSALDVTVQAKQNANDAALATTSKNVVGAINEVNGKIGGLFKVVEVNLFSDKEISGQTEYNSNGSSIPHATVPTQSGYTPIAVVNARAWGYYGSRSVVYAWFNNAQNTQIAFSAYNSWASSGYTARVSASCWVLYVKNTSV